MKGENLTVTSKYHPFPPKGGGGVKKNTRNIFICICINERKAVNNAESKQQVQGRENAGKKEKKIQVPSKKKGKTKEIIICARGTPGSTRVSSKMESFWPWEENPIIKKGRFLAPETERACRSSRGRPSKNPAGDSKYQTRAGSRRAKSSGARKPQDRGAQGHQVSQK